ncbi:HAD-IIA family hydrolase [Sciscionella sediminilitoris]|uniref:HAD-IIA family hydrolase n=1 Tax=Sciscionella sediminilitoris TaxID=1445613 RepID=UPI0004DF93FE|nr:HAD-IIA family hydrolase [Sciscionella sp. SE31]
MILDRYDALLLDLDGTVYRGTEAVDGAQEAVRAAAEHGVSVRFVTNNASRAPETVATGLRELGIAATAGEVDTSAQAAAAVVADQVGPGSAVLVVGSPALAEEIAALGLRPVRDNTGPVAAVVQGLSKDIGWSDLAEACIAINAGARWVAANTDPTLPTERGLLPGNGSLVAALRAATGAEPVVAGKPEAPLMRAAIEAAGARTPLVVGDRLDTDIAGAVTVGADSMLVLSGVSGATELLGAPAARRPTYIAADLAGVFGEPDRLAVAEDPDWTVRESGDGLTVSGDGDPIGLLRTLCAIAWRMPSAPKALEAHGGPADAALRALGLGERDAIG